MLRSTRAQMRVSDRNLIQIRLTCVIVIQKGRALTTKTRNIIGTSHSLIKVYLGVEAKTQ